MQKHYRLTYSDTVYADTSAEARRKFKEVFIEFKIDELWYRGGPFEVRRID